MADSEHISLNFVNYTAQQNVQIQSFAKTSTRDDWQICNYAYCCYLQRQGFSGVFKKIVKIFVDIVAENLLLKCIYKPETSTYRISLQLFVIFQEIKKNNTPRWLHLSLIIFLSLFVTIWNTKKISPSVVISVFGPNTGISKPGETFGPLSRSENQVPEYYQSTYVNVDTTNLFDNIQRPIQTPVKHLRWSILRK